MSLGFGNVGLEVFSAKVTFGKSEIYPKGRHSANLTRQYAGFGGEQGNGGAGNNQMAALQDGSFKRIISHVTVDGGGRLDYYTRVNGVDTLRGLNSGIGIVDIVMDVSFLKDDIVAIAYQRNNSNGTFIHMDTIEVEWNDPLGQDIKHIYGALYRTGATVDGYMNMLPMNNGGQFPLTDESEFKWKVPRSGKILDIVYYGSSPVGIDNIPEFALRKNGVDAFTGVLTQHGSKAIDRYDGIDISFAKGDELNYRIRSALNGTVCEGTGACRIQFD